MILCLPGYITGSCSNVEARLSPRHSSMGCGHPKWGPNLLYTNSFFMFLLAYDAAFSRFCSYPWGFSFSSCPSFLRLSFEFHFSIAAVWMSPLKRIWGKEHCGIAGKASTYLLYPICSGAAQSPEQWVKYINLSCDYSASNSLLQQRQTR